MIRIFGCHDDPHVQAVADRLTCIGHEFRILDIFDAASDGFTKEVAPGVGVSLGRTRGDPREPDAVWWRIKPAFIVSAASVADYYDQQFGLREWLAALDYMSVLYRNAAWVNQSGASARASNKIHQLAVAPSHGFSVPRTLVTNDASNVRQFISSLGGKRCIHKTITPYVCPDGRQKYTSFVDANTVEAYSAEMGVCPAIYQEYIRPQFELRITVVGDALFAVKIEKKHSEPDWRAEMFEDIYAPYEFPAAFKERLIRLHRSFGLVFAAYDFVVDEDGAFVFLEVNPAGQWLWLEDRLELPVSDALARRLIDLSDGTAYDGKSFAAVPSGA